MSYFKKMVLIGAFVIAMPQTWAANTPSNNNDEELDGVAAIVNDHVITNSEVDQRIDTIKKQLAAQQKPIPSNADMRKQILNMMINMQVQLEIADRADIQVDQDELNQAMERMASGNHVTLETMRSQIEAQGMSYTKFRTEMKNQIRLQKLQQSAVGSKVTVTDKEVNAAMAQMSGSSDSNTEYHVANILISLPEAPTTQQLQTAQNKADSVMKKIKAGTEFTKVASSDSDGDTSLQGGDLGWRKVAEIPSIFADKLKTMHDGDVAGPLRAPNGLHIIKLIESHLDTTNQPDKNQVKNMIYNRKMSEKVGEWVQEMRDGAYVKIIT